ncbi:MAG: Di-glucose binding within endoplasmic reticulum [Planctomycetes bacterium ADurb.Bin412]|nr:MAG: Di-glucose binding within endoplasmic reticulum [Planctomycetes bacterium ADurb.Bin412]
MKILQGEKQIWPQQDWATAALNDFAGVQHDVRAEVAAGEKIRFVLDRGTSEGSDVKDIIAWMPRIVFAGAEEGAAPAGGSTVRILCGSPRDYTDGCGNVWLADRYYIGGKPYQTAAEITAVLPTEKDQSLYQGGRAGKEFTYRIPVQPGLYALRLKCTEPEFEYFFSRPFCLEINGREAIRNEDICHIARGPRRACDRIFRYLVPDGDGNLVLRFRGGWDPLQETDAALVQAIEVLPEHLATVRINVGADQDFVDWNSDLWAADTNREGNVLRSEVMVEQASPTLYDQELYRTARSGKELTYSFAVPAGLYTVHLKFAELWLNEAGQRPMDIAINGRCFWKSWDPSIQAGKLAMSADVRVDGITPDQQGLITLRINAAGNQDAILQAIEIE